MLLLAALFPAAACGGAGAVLVCSESDPECRVPDADSDPHTGLDGPDPVVEDAGADEDASDDDGAQEDVEEEELPPDPLRFGHETTFEIATWNLENFPADSNTPLRAAELIRRMDLDLVAVQEINDPSDFRAMVEELSGYEGVQTAETCGTGTFQMTGFLYRSSKVELDMAECLYRENSYAFPRPPLEGLFTVQRPGLQPLQLVVINVHLKAGVGEDDEARRREGVEILEDRIVWIVESSSADGVILLGDMNDELDDPASDNVFTPLLEDPGSTVFLTASLAVGGTYSYIPYRRLIDHIMITAGLVDDYGGGQTVVMALDAMDLGYDYESAISDHRPVMALFPAP
jgi:endonuclease/exonuclease/phosphatase family metal-dependent hydrolase